MKMNGQHTDRGPIEHHSQTLNRTCREEVWEANQFLEKSQLPVFFVAWKQNLVWIRHTSFCGPVAADSAVSQVA